MIATLIVNDIKLFFGNRFFAVITGMALVLYLAIYFLLPNQADTSVGVAFYMENPAVTPWLGQLIAEESDLVAFASEAAMLAALEDTDDFFVGLSVPAEAAQAITRGEKATLHAFYAPGVPAEAKQMFHDVLLFLANATQPDMMARLSRITDTEVVLGHDLLGKSLSIQDRFVPLFLLAMVMTEVLGLATLIIREIESGTVRALITGPLRLHEFFLGKLVVGLVLTFGQVLLFTVITGKIGTSPILLLTTLLLGSLMIVGVAFLIAAISRNNMSVMAWGVLTMILFLVPVLSIMLPGLASGWMEVVPSYYFADTLHRILNFDAGWADVSRSLTLLAAVGLGTLVIGSAGLRQRF